MDRFHKMVMYTEKNQNLLPTFLYTIEREFVVCLARMRLTESIPAEYCGGTARRPSHNCTILSQKHQSSRKIATWPACMKTSQYLAVTSLFLLSREKNVVFCLCHVTSLENAFVEPLHRREKASLLWRCCEKTLFYKLWIFRLFRIF